MAQSLLYLAHGTLHYIQIHNTYSSSNTIVPPAVISCQSKIVFQTLITNTYVLSARLLFVVANE
jgi:hypothetical protein